ncbi:hypothetical protein D0469_16910 [Peribacillus saganii]|uniref:Uncharacterized protein n=1 Tax=Peribacillus saganii TaxID=2303992 RepID=A0A372LIV0_9BACI|nr:hypothetical protein D0469_16910 [Peribacillus saganii]
MRRGGSPPAPRKAKRLERKLTDPINRPNKKITAGKLDFIEFVYSLRHCTFSAFFEAYDKFSLKKALKSKQYFLPFVQYNLKRLKEHHQVIQLLERY